MTPSTSIRVLIVEDSVEDTFFIVRELQRGGFQVDFERVETATAMAAALESKHWDLIISDYFMPLFGGQAALALHQERARDVPVIIVSGGIGEDRAVELVKAGAHDYIMKDNLRRLAPAVKNELRAALERNIRRQTEQATTFLASLVQSSDDAITGKTLEGVVVSWNTGAERLYGYSAVEMIGRPISVLFPQTRSAELAGILKSVRAGRHVETFDSVRVRKDGSQVEVSVTISPVRDAQGRIIGSSSIARCITHLTHQTA